jgi:hypothetical protein
MARIPVGRDPGDALSLLDASYEAIGNAPRMHPRDWPFPHAGIMATIVTQDRA